MSTTAPSCAVVLKVLSPGRKVTSAGGLIVAGIRLRWSVNVAGKPWLGRRQDELRGPGLHVSGSQRATTTGFPVPSGQSLLPRTARPRGVGSRRRMGTG